MAILTDKTALTAPNLNDVIHIVDVSDTTSNPAGTSKKVALSFLQDLFQATKLKVVNTLTDLPAPAAEVITLADGVVYALGNDIDLGLNRIVVGVDSGFIGFNSNSPTLTYTGVGVMFTGRQKSFQSFNLRMNCATGKVYDFHDDVTPGQSSVLLNNIDAANCAKVGTFNDLAVFDISTVVSMNAGDGIDFIGTAWFSILINGIELVTTSPSFRGIDFGTAVSTNITVRDHFFMGPSGSLAINAAGANANLPVGATGTITGGNVTGLMTPVAGITSADIRWFLSGNGQISDSSSVGAASLTNNVAQTVISAINTPTKVVGTFAPEVSSQYTVDASGTITFLSERDNQVSIDATATILATSGNRTVTLTLAINGVSILNSGQTVIVGSTDPISVTTFWEIQLTLGDTVEMFVSNNSGTQNLVVNDAILRVK